MPTPYLSYNNLPFVGNFNSHVSSRFVYDRAGRTVAHTVHTITASYKTVAPGGTGIDAYVQVVRQKLSKPGAALVYQNTGAGALVLNTAANGPQDIVWGPKPQILSEKPLGGGNAVILEWQCDVAIADCSSASYTGIAEATYDVHYDTTSTGLVNRVMDYNLRIASRRSASGRGLLDSPDFYLSLIMPPLLTGFRREFGPRTVNAAKDTVSGTVTDIQMGGVYPPPYVTKWKASADVTANQVGGVRWVGSISASYTTSVDCPDLTIPAQHFFNVFAKDRVWKLQQALNNDPTTWVRDKNGMINRQVVLPYYWRMAEPDIAAPERVFEFRLDYRFTCALGAILNVCGLWRPVPGSDDWASWSNSLLGSAFNPTGFLNLQFNPGEDRITDLCDTGTATLGGTGGTGPDPSAPDGTPLSDFFSEIIQSITPANSWAAYKITPELVPESGSVTLRTLPAVPLPNPAGTLGLVGGAIAGGPAGLMNVSGNPLPPNVPGGRAPTSPSQPNNPATTTTTGTQQRTNDTWRVRIRGSARRVVYPIPMPTITNIAGCVPTPMFDPQTDGFAQEAVANLGGVVVYGAEWCFTFLIAGPFPKGGVTTLPNPLLGS